METKVNISSVAKCGELNHKRKGEHRKRIKASKRGEKGKD